MEVYLSKFRAADFEEALKGSDYGKGMQVERDRFWDVFQNYGNRTDYGYAFWRGYWIPQNLRPKYDIRPTSLYYTFYGNYDYDGDLAQTLEDCGVILDTSQCTNFDYCFYHARNIRRLPVIDLRGQTTLDAVFHNAQRLYTIDGLIVNEHNVFRANVFQYCYDLRNITIEGVIGNNISFPQSEYLTHDSLMSIINALQPKTSGTFTLTIGSNNLAKLTDAEKAIATGKGWTLA